MGLKYRIQMNLHFKIESSETKKRDLKLLFCVTNKPCVFPKRVFSFLFTIFLRLRVDSTHVTATKFALALPPEKYQFAFYNCVNSDCVYTNLWHEQRDAHGLMWKPFDSQNNKLSLRARVIGRVQPSGVKIFWLWTSP